MFLQLKRESFKEANRAVYQNKNLLLPQSEK